MHLTSMRFLMGTFLSVSALLAMEPPDPGMIETYSKDGTLPQKIAFAKAMGNHTVGNGLAERSQYKLKKLAMDKGLIKKGVLPTPPDAWKDMPTTGQVKVLTICIDFNDYQHVEAKNSIAQMQDRIFGDGDIEVAAPYESFRQYYLRSSYGKLDFSGSVLGWFRPTYDRAAMAETTLGREQLIKEALQQFDTAGIGHDFSQYDNNGDGKIDFFSVIWSGPHGAWSSFWWGYQTSFTDDAFKLDGVGFGKYSWQWESRVRAAGIPDAWNGPFSPKTLIHEQGHGLGLPDYYDYDDAVGPRGGVGGYDMMDWVGDHNCFSKWLLDWIEPSIVNTTLPGGLTGFTASLRSSETSEDALVVMPGIAAVDFGSPGASQPFGEFFMVQNRQRTGNDLNNLIPGSGLVVWHVDSRLDASNFDYRYDNSFTEHKLLRLMEADGLEQIETDAADADANDFYGPGKEIGPTTVPNTARYDGTWTNFGIRDISASQPTMTFDIYTTAPDTTPPTGNPTQPTGTVSTDSVTFAWTLGTSVDADGPIVGYQLQVGSTVGGSDVFNGMVGAAVTQTLSELFIWDGQPLYARVRAMNSAGLYTDWSPDSLAVVVVLPIFDSSVLDNTNLQFKASGNWETDSVDYRQGTSSAVVNHLNDNSRTTLQTKVIGGGTFTYWWKASTEKDFDYYSFLIDGVVQQRLSGDVAWTQVSTPIPAGTHTLSWSWAKDSNTGGTVDKTWLDDVQYSGSAPVFAPTITGFTPASGLAGTVVTITGTKFTGATAVSFHGIPATSFTVDSATQITATAPVGATSGSILVTIPGGGAVSATLYTYPGDIDGDGTYFDILDLAMLAWAHGSTPASPNWAVAADLNSDNQVNDTDLNLFLAAAGF